MSSSKVDRFKTYLFSYQHNGAKWGFDVKANSLEDAKSRLAKMAYATYDGILVASVTVPTGGFLSRLVSLFLPATKRDR